MKPPHAALVIAYCAGIFWLSADPDPPDPGFEFPGKDKAAHMALYGGLAAVVGMGLNRAESRRSARFRFWVPILFAACYGLTDEIHQRFVPHRTFELADLAADALGALLVQSALTACHRTRSSLWDPK